VDGIQVLNPELSWTGLRYDRVPLEAGAIAPALIETEVTSNPKASHGLIPVGHFGSVEDIAAVAVMLAMKDYMTGQTILVNGGWYMS
jgi:3-oxoacyl-[acyl-carrier protein] reductase